MLMLPHKLPSATMDSMTTTQESQQSFIPSLSCNSLDEINDHVIHKKQTHEYLTRRLVRTKTNNGNVDIHSLLMNYSTDPYEFDDEILLDVAVAMWEFYGLFSEFSFAKDACKQFLRSIRALYNPENSFHNFKHVWSVMHTCFQILYYGADKFLSKSDILAVFIAAICHDVRHPGNSNAFESAIQSDVYRTYKREDEVCVLERYHASITETLLSQEWCKDILLYNFSPVMRANLIKQVQFIIMGTDMSKHHYLVSEVNELYTALTKEHQIDIEEVTGMMMGIGAGSGSAASASGSSNPPSPKLRRKTPKVRKSKLVDGMVVIANTQSEDSAAYTKLKGGGRPPKTRYTPTPPPVADDDNVPVLPSSLRDKLTRIIVHVADIGAQTQHIDSAHKWTFRCYTEFKNQASKEIEHGIVTSPFLHDLGDNEKIYKSQFFFISETVEPIWNNIVRLVPRLRFAVKNLQHNKEFYMLKIHEEGKKRSKIMEGETGKDKCQPIDEDQVAKKKAKK